MNLSSILVFTKPDNLQTVQTSLCALPGIEIHYHCQDTGRIIVTQEALDNNAEMNGLQQIKGIPQVTAAEMFYHYVDDDMQQTDHEEALPC